MSEDDRLTILFILTVGFCVLAINSSILLEEYLAGATGSFVIGMFWLHLWYLEKENKKL